MGGGGVLDSHVWCADVILGAWAALQKRGGGLPRRDLDVHDPPESVTKAAQHSVTSYNHNTVLSCTVGACVHASNVILLRQHDLNYQVTHSL